MSRATAKPREVIRLPCWLCGEGVDRWLDEVTHNGRVQTSTTCEGCRESERVMSRARMAARVYLAVTAPECAETGAALPRETWTPGFRGAFEELEQLAKEE
jgi:ssDNA-binding Zn-finger/Zn-ribbon topoisomerase 1